MLKKISAIIGLALATMLSPAMGDEYPSKPIRVVVGFAPGGGTDLLGRVLADKLTAKLGQTVVVENKPGAGGTIGAAEVARSAPDGYTLLVGTQGMMSSAPFAVNPPPYDPINDFEHISLLATSHLLLYVHDDFPAKDFAELVKVVQENPGKYTYASAGHMGPAHMFTELLSRSVDLPMRHIPYAGDGKATPDVLGGVVPIWASGAGAFPSYKQGKIRALVTSGPERWSEIPEAPTVAELGYPEATTTYYNHLLAPKGTPVEIVNKLHEAIVEIYKDKDATDKILASGVIPQTLPPAETLETVKEDVALWKDIVANLVAAKK